MENEWYAGDTAYRFSRIKEHGEKDQKKVKLYKYQVFSVLQKRTCSWKVHELVHHFFTHHFLTDLHWKL